MCLDSDTPESRRRVLSETDSDTSDVPPELPPRTPSRTVSTVTGAAILSNGEQRSLRAVSIVSTDAAAVPGSEQWTSGNEHVYSSKLTEEQRQIK